MAVELMEKAREQGWNKNSSANEKTDNRLF